jgi:AcrR family transcriptional regulator
LRSRHYAWQQQLFADGRLSVTATNTGRKRPGRPAGSSDTRDRILANARALFARNGIANTSIRAVAAATGVDSALVHHYFGTKEKLFAAAVRVPIDPMDIIGPLRQVPVEELGHAIPSMLLPLWDSELGTGLIATLRSIMAGSEVNLFRSFIQDVIAVEVGTRVDNPPGTGIIRIQFVASQLVGVLMARYILHLEPFTSLPVEQIIDTIAPNLQRYLTGDLPAWPAS